MSSTDSYKVIFRFYISVTYSNLISKSHCGSIVTGKMSCSRTPPSSPRAPKIQQQSWDDCGTPPIDLFDPSKDIHSPRSPSTRNHFDPPLSPKAYR